MAFKVKPKRPINLDLTTIKLPIMAIASILHRISGILLFLLMPFLLYVLDLSLRTPDSFEHLHILFQCLYVKAALWVFGSAMVYHVLAGIRHILGDIGLGESLSASRISAYVVMTLSLVMIILLGILIW